MKPVVSKTKYLYRYTMDDVAELFNSKSNTVERAIYEKLGDKRSNELFDKLTSGSLDVALSNGENVNFNFGIVEKRTDEYVNEEKYTFSDGSHDYLVEVKNTEGKNIAQISFGFDPRLGPEKLSMYSLKVDSGYPSKEIGNLLVQAIENIAKQMGVVHVLEGDALTLDSKLGNGEELFKNLGYAEGTKELRDHEFLVWNKVILPTMENEAQPNNDK